MPSRSVHAPLACDLMVSVEPPRAASILLRRMPHGLPFLVAVALLVSACSEAPEEVARTPRPSPESASATTPRPDRVSAAGAPRVPLEQVQDFLVRTGSPDWLAVGFGSLWVKRDDGSVLRVGPDGQVMATIEAGPIQSQPLCQGIGVSEESVWACREGTMFRIDPTTNSVTDLVRIPKLADQGRLISRAGLLWVLVRDGDRLVGLAEDGQVERTIRLGTFCTDLGTGESDLLWVACSYEGLLLRVDPEAGEVTGRVKLPNATSVSVAVNAWVNYAEGLARVDPESLEIEAVYDIDMDVYGSVWASADEVWVRTDGGPFLTEIDPDSGEVVRVVESRALPSGGDVVRYAGRLWATAFDDSAVVGLDPP